ncbi:hypothetical protein PIB30_013319 [Stylosanthes scabra]|uniref:Uncharacterized protein n=1 Tax=Stylosanthes scabra TaxID=79078 RepID=A0ABU6U563_9FABA|nr:hypothetical protein [Stylosanthes scabra]
MEVGENHNPNGVAMKIKEMLEEAQPLFTEECCIYRVPHEIRKHNEDAYTPKVVSIGPFHHGNEKLLKIEGQKRIYCREFIQRSETKNLEIFVSCVQDVEPKIRGCYSDEIKLSKEELVMVILVDCCFILELLSRYHFKWPCRDAIFRSLGLRSDIIYDLFLVENQVPFFVLEKLYNLAFPSTLNSGNHSHPPLLWLTRYIVHLGIFTDSDKLKASLSNVVRIDHFTDLLRKLLLISSHLLQPSSPGCSREAELTHLYSATELNEAGVKFEANKNSRCLLDLELSGHCLRIPFIRVVENTEAILRNLLAFEQCHCIDESYLVDYIIFIDFLINTDKDVNLLIKKGIIQNGLGDSNAVAKMFNGLTLGSYSPDFNMQYSLIVKDLNDFCEHPWNRKVATLKRDYCNTPWKTVASMAAIFLLILTIIQTIFSILQGKRQQSHTQGHKMANPNHNEVAIKIKAMLEEAQPRFAEECCIYRVPHEIRKHNEDAYTPKVVSIGPFHHGNEKLLNMEGQKRLYCRKFIERSETKNLESFVSCVQELEAEVRGCYSDEIMLSKEEHVMVILVDCCFILQFLHELYFMVTRGDPLFLPLRLGSSICSDLFLLENQVPFFVLDKLQNLAFPSTLSSGIHNHIFLLLPAFGMLPANTITGYNLEQILTNVGRVAHFTDLSRKLLLTSSQLFQPSASGCSREGKLMHIYSASELKELGVKFEVNKNSKCLLDLELSGHTLRIPFTKVVDTTEVLLRNLVAFEQCHHIHEAYLTDYILFLDFLINTDSDVDLLIKEGIIENWLGDSYAVAKMFNGLGVNIENLDYNNKYSLIIESLNAFCASCRVQKFATLKRDYCNTPWQAAATFAAIFLLILTVIQTVFSVLQGIH